MIDFNRHNEIERYLQGNMSAEEVIAFEERLKNDVHLKEEVELQQAANTVVIGAATLELKNKLQNIHQKEQKRKTLRKVAIVTAGVLLIGAIVALFSLAGKKDDPKEHITPVNYWSTPSTQEEKTELEKKELKKEGVVIAVAEGREDKTSSPIIKPVEIADSKQTTRVEDPQKDFELSKDKAAVSEPTNLCAKVAVSKPIMEFQNPCIGNTSAMFNVQNTGVTNFSEFSVNGGKDYQGINESLQLELGSYQLVARDKNGCLSQAVAFEVKYNDCNYNIQRSMQKNLELDLSSFSNSTSFEVRSAKTGGIVYSEFIEYPSTFNYKGYNQSGNVLPIGTYVYLFKSKEGKIIAKGQIAILK